MGCERSNGPQQRAVRDTQQLGSVGPAEIRPLIARGACFARAQRLGVAVGEEEVAQVEVHVAVGPGVLVDVDHQRPTGWMGHGRTGLLDRLPQRCDLGRFAGLDVTTGLQPDAQPSMPVQQYDPVADVEHERGAGDVGGQRGAQERVLHRGEQPLGVLDGLSFLVIAGLVVREQSVEPLAARVLARVLRGAQRRTCLVTTVPSVANS